MVRRVTEDEIKDAMFSIAGNKAPGPDGYTSVFFKKAWDVVGKDVCLAIQEFFQNGNVTFVLDRILQWNRKVHGSMNQMCCLLCYANLETHEHLFFQCSYSDKVWNLVRSKVGMNMVDERWDDIVEWLIPRAKSRAIRMVASRLVVAASAYGIWRERNARFFSNRVRPPEQISEIILDTVRTKLISFKFKANNDVRSFLEEWKIDGVEFFNED
ncbi:uncharacterized protein LOC110914555 [Helianthus annuus]|uniref:uncharacterized protein LOC110914555 n=1 Tax=Helianthus annuus TaxID=4232 RepID=UPI000B8F89BB|nr:uncharacterized protein LOC110914555 [Helianthus annuus]